jgi:putative phosphoribosyl transferase
VCLKTPEPFIAIGIHYRDFHQLSDDDAVGILAAVEAKHAKRPEGASL